MSTPESGSEYSPRRAREGVDNSIRRKNHRAIWLQRTVTAVSLGLGAMCVGLQENDAAKWIPIPAVVAVGTAAAGVNAQKRNRLETQALARDYILSLEPLGTLEPKTEETTSAPATPINKEWYDRAPEYSALASVCGALGAYLAPTELIHKMSPAYGVYSPGIFLVAGSVVAQVMTERSIHAHEGALMNEMNAAEARAA